MSLDEEKEKVFTFTTAESLCDELTCFINIARNATCFGSLDGILEVIVGGGAGPYKYLWAHDTSTTYQKVIHGGTGGKRYAVTVIDALGKSCEASKILGPSRALSASIKIERQVSCQGASDAILNLTVVGGSAPYRFEWSGGGATEEDVYASAGIYNVVVTDKSGCMTTAKSYVHDPAHLSVSVAHKIKSSENDFLGGVLTVSIDGGVPPFKIESSSGIVGPVESVSPGKFEAHISKLVLGVCKVFVTDHVGCRREVSTPVEMDEVVCPDLVDCFEKSHMFWSVYNFCLRKVVAPVVWKKDEWSCCRASGLLAIMKSLHERSHGRDYGATYVALLLGRAILDCQENCCEFSLEHSVEPFLQSVGNSVSRLYEQRKHIKGFYAGFMRDAMTIMLFGDGFEDNIDGWENTVLTVGPYGFDNEPIFAPGLALPQNNTKVVTLVLKEYVFPSSSVLMAEFPFTLQVDVDLAALFLRDAMQIIKPKWVFAADSAGVLVMGKLAVMLEENHAGFPSVYEALQRSYAWPPTYPPPHLSKLLPGHEKFAPKEVIVSESDGLHLIQPDMEVALQALRTMKTSKTFIKREYSEASRGVAQVFGEVGFEKAMVNVFPRATGMTSMDLDLKVRIFLQEGIVLSPRLRPVGFRFFAQAGKILAGHLSGSVEGNIVYETERNERVEEATIELIQATNYSGFGAAWWWRDVEGTPYLIDFNPRLERHTCLHAVLSQAEDLEKDPCFAFQQGKILQQDYIKSAPHILRGGIRYMDPVRAMSGPKLQIQRLLQRNPTNIPWNMQHGDGKLMELVKKKVADTVRRNA
jgi:hypothetical protein